MGKKFFWINLFLILIVVYLAVKNYEEWTIPKPQEKETIEGKAKAAAPASSPAATKKAEAPPPAHYKTISEKNPFSPERKEFPIPLPKPEPEGPPPPKVKPPVRPNLVLYGVAIGEDFRTALVNNPTRRAEKGERDSMTVRVGDKVGEYSVTQIQDDRITLESSGDSFDVLLFDPSRQRKRPVVAPAPATTPEKPGQPGRVVPSPQRPFTPPATPPTVTPPARETPGRDLLRERLEQRRLQRPPAPTSPPVVQPPRRPPVSKRVEEDEEDEEDDE